MASAGDVGSDVVLTVDALLRKNIDECKRILNDSIGTALREPGCEYRDILPRSQWVVEYGPDPGFAVCCYMFSRLGYSSNLDLRKVLQFIETIRAPLRERDIDVVDTAFYLECPEDANVAMLRIVLRQRARGVASAPAAEPSAPARVPATGKSRSRKRTRVEFDHGQGIAVLSTDSGDVAIHYPFDDGVSEAVERALRQNPEFAPAGYTHAFEMARMVMGGVAMALIHAGKTIFRDESAAKRRQDANGRASGDSVPFSVTRGGPEGTVIISSLRLAADVPLRMSSTHWSVLDSAYVHSAGIDLKQRRIDVRFDEGAALAAHRLEEAATRLYSDAVGRSDGSASSAMTDARDEEETSGGSAVGTAGPGGAGWGKLREDDDDDEDEDGAKG